MTPMRGCERLRLPVKRVQVKSKGKGKSRMEQFKEATHRLQSYSLHAIACPTHHRHQSRSMTARC
jgi:hypothetical protein